MSKSATRGNSSQTAIVCTFPKPLSFGIFLHIRKKLWAVNRRYMRKYRQLSLHKERKPQEYFGLLHQSFTF